MSDNVIRAPTRSLKEQFSKGSDAWKEQSDPIFRFWTEGDCWGFPFFGFQVGTGQISEAGVSSTTLLSFVLYNLLHAHEVPTRQG